MGVTHGDTHICRSLRGCRCRLSGDAAGDGSEAVRGGLRLQWTARHRLLEANVIVQQRNTTRDGRTASVTAGAVLVVLGIFVVAFNFARVHAD